MDIDFAQKSFGEFVQLFGKILKNFAKVLDKNGFIGYYIYTR